MALAPRPGLRTAVSGWKNRVGDLPMARAIWSGSISFGLLNVPVKLYSAVARRGISLREIRESDSARIKHRRVAEGTDEEVPYDKIIKAFEITKDRYVPLSKDELASLAPKKTRAIDGPGLRRHRRDRPDLLRQPLLPGPGRGRREGLLAAGPGDGGVGQGGDRPLRLPQQGAPGGDAPRRRRADPDHDALRRRGRAAVRARRRAALREAEGGQAGGRDGRAADRLADPRASTRPPTATSTARSCWR